MHAVFSIKLQYPFLEDNHEFFTKLIHAMSYNQKIRLNDANILKTVQSQNTDRGE